MDTNFAGTVLNLAQPTRVVQITHHKEAFTGQNLNEIKHFLPKEILHPG